MGRGLSRAKLTETGVKTTLIFTGRQILLHSWVDFFEGDGLDGALI